MRQLGLAGDEQADLEVHGGVGKAVQRAALKELLIAVALILVLRLMPRGLLPERIPRAPLAGGRP